MAQFCFEAFLPIVLAIIGYYVPGKVTAVWLVVNSEGSLGMKLVWAVTGFFLEYLALIPFIGLLLVGKRPRVLDEFFRNAQQSSRGRILNRCGNSVINDVSLAVAAVWHRDPVGTREIPAILKVLLDPEATLVHERVMLRAK